MKKYIIIVIVIIFATIIFSTYRNQNGIQSPKIDTSHLTELLINQKLIDAGDVNDMPATIIAQISNSNSTVVFLEIPEWSGTGGRSAFIFSKTQQANEWQVLGNFFGSANLLNKTLSLRGDNLIYSETQSKGACCVLSKDVEINLKNGVIISPDLTDSIDSYAKRHKLSADSDSLSESISNYKKLGDNDLTFERSVYIAGGEKFPTETWQYNVKTGEYKLIK